MSTKTIQAGHLTELLAYQELRSKALQEVEDLQALIDKQETLKSQARAAMLSTADLEQKRASLLADIAMGKKPAESLRLFDEDVKAQKGEIDWANEDQNNKIQTANQTITGLQPKLKDAQKAFDEIDAQKSDLLMDFVTQEAEAIGESYIKLTKELGQKWNQMVALSALKNMVHQTRGKNRSADYSFTFRAFEIRIPKFKLAVFGPTQDWYDGLLFDSSKIIAGEQAAIEKARFRDLGVKLFD